MSDKFNEIGPLTSYEVNKKAYKIRVKAAKYQEALPLVENFCNGDEFEYLNKIACFSKGFLHDKLGIVNLEDYIEWINALASGDSKQLENINIAGERKLANPMAAYCYDLAGSNSHKLYMKVPPKFDSPENSGEIAEVYWRALTRDIPFLEYENNQLINCACCDLSRFSIFKGPKIKGRVTPKTIFRGSGFGNLQGPYVSQFLYKDIPFGNKVVDQKYLSPVKGIDYMVDYKSWLDIQNGEKPESKGQFESEYTYIKNGRDLAEYVHKDFPYQAGLNACLILLGYGESCYSVENPYLKSKTQKAFLTFGSCFILDFVAKVARLALEAAWFQKFLVHRRLRPEAFAGCINTNLTTNNKFPINSEILNSPVLAKVYEKYGNYLMPMSYPEGSPMHPAYPAGHATIIGACVTVLKAFFDEDFIIPDPVQSNVDGTALESYNGAPLTVLGELNKLAANVSHGRDTAGVHWRSDGTEGIKLGEQVAINLLQDFKITYAEEFRGFEFTSFDGRKITI